VHPDCFSTISPVEGVAFGCPAESAVGWGVGLSVTAIDGDRDGSELGCVLGCIPMYLLGASDFVALGSGLGGEDLVSLGAPLGLKVKSNQVCSDVSVVVVGATGRVGFFVGLLEGDKLGDLEGSSWLVGSLTGRGVRASAGVTGFADGLRVGSRTVSTAVVVGFRVAGLGLGVTGLGGGGAATGLRLGLGVGCAGFLVGFGVVGAGVSVGAGEGANEGDSDGANVGAQSKSHPCCKIDKK